MSIQILISMHSIVTTNLFLFEENDTDANLMKILLEKVGMTNIHIAKNEEESVFIFTEYNPAIALFSINSSNIECLSQLIEKIKEIECIPLIFISEEYTEKMYSKVKMFNPYSFINKQLSLVSLKQSIELALKRDKVSLRKTNELTSKKSENYQDYIFVQVGNHYKKINISDIWWIESEGKYSALKSENSRILIDISIRDLAEKLNDKGFSRIHKSYIINLKCVDYVDKNNIMVFLKDESLPIGRSFKSSFYKQIKFT